MILLHKRERERVATKYYKENRHCNPYCKQPNKKWKLKKKREKASKKSWKRGGHRRKKRKRAKIKDDEERKDSRCSSYSYIIAEGKIKTDEKFEKEEE